jgi:hypothetical protein
LYIKGRENHFDFFFLFSLEKGRMGVRVNIYFKKAEVNHFNSARERGSEEARRWVERRAGMDMQERESVWFYPVCCFPLFDGKGRREEKEGGIVSNVRKSVRCIIFLYARVVVSC